MSELDQTRATGWQVAIRTDAGQLIGGGHVMRCLTLADALAEHGAKVTFVTAAMPDPLARRIEGAGHGIARITAEPGLTREGADWHDPPLNDEAQRRDAEASMEAIGGTADWVVVDHYLLGRAWEEAARKAARQILVIDDLANRPHDCDILLDQTLGRAESDYASLVQAHTKVLAGPHYALLRPEFARERPAARKRRAQAHPPRRILVSLGTMDIGGATAQAVEAVLAAAPECAVDVILGESAPSMDKLGSLAASNPRVALHVDSSNVAELMRDADIAVGAAGTSSWERCCLGLPAIVLVLAENQRPSADALAAAGAALVIDAAGRVGSILPALLHDPQALQAMSAAAFAICDGSGASRNVQAMAGDGATSIAASSINLRRATHEDSELIWLWRNDPVTRAASRNSRPIAWAGHAEWLAAVLADPARRLLVAESNGVPVGIVRFDPIPGTADFEISINVRPDARGFGTAGTILSAACARSAADLGHARVHAAVAKSNLPSRKLFESCGFALIEANAPDGFLRFVLDLSSSHEPDRRAS